MLEKQNSEPPIVFYALNNGSLSDSTQNYSHHFTKKSPLNVPLKPSSYTAPRNVRNPSIRLWNERGGFIS